jgi:hypothetical protein
MAAGVSGPGDARRPRQRRGRSRRLLVPELQRRGLFRKECAGPTLRENLGLPIPLAADWHAARFDFFSLTRACARETKKSQHDPNKCLNLNRNGCNISIKLCIDQAKSYDQDLYRGDVNPGFGDGTIVEHDPAA